MGTDMNERVFKVLGSGGMTITDATPGYRAWFTPNELLVPGNLDEYHEMVHQALDDSDFNHRYRLSGYRAVMERHTYAHRARMILNHLGIPVPDIQ
jgi:spore maturation protein CgeB